MKEIINDLPKEATKIFGLVSLLISMKYMDYNGRKY